MGNGNANPLGSARINIIVKRKRKTFSFFPRVGVKNTIKRFFIYVYYSLKTWGDG